MTDPKVFPCDEPTQAVDVKTRNEIYINFEGAGSGGQRGGYVSSDLKEIS